MVCTRDDGGGGMDVVNSVNMAMGGGVLVN